MFDLLNGIRVLDLCRLIPGAVATGKLADLGAEVIKVEEPVRGDYQRDLPPLVGGMNFYYMMLNRNKRSLGLDLKSKAGRLLFFELLDTADVIVEVSKPGTFKKLGLDYDSVRARKPDIIYCSVTGYGQSGPFGSLPSHGMNIDAAAGMIRIVRDGDGNPEIDLTSRAMAIGIEMGGLHAAMAVMAALVKRSSTGHGEYIDASCWDAAVSSNIVLARALNLGKTTKFDPRGKDGILGSRYNVYATRDDRIIFLCPIEKKYWRNFCRAVGRPDWQDRGEWKHQVDLGSDDPALRDDLRQLIRTRSLDQWMEIFLAADVPASPVLDAQSIADNEHTLQRRIVAGSTDPRYPEVRFLRPPFMTQGTDYSIDLAPPLLGEDSHAILGELGYDESDLARFIAEGTVAATSRRRRKAIAGTA